MAHSITCGFMNFHQADAKSGITLKIFLTRIHILTLILNGILRKHR